MVWYSKVSWSFKGFFQDFFSKIFFARRVDIRAELVLRRVGPRRKVQYHVKVLYTKIVWRQKILCQISLHQISFCDEIALWQIICTQTVFCRFTLAPG